MGIDRAHRSARRMAVIMSACAALVLGISPAAAVQYEKTVSYDVTETFGYSDCGFDIDGEGRYWGTFATRQGTGPDASAFFGRNRYALEEVHTRVSNGVTVTVAGHGQFIEVRATRVEGSIFQFTAVSAGLFTITDDSGTIVGRDVGSIRESILFDTLGDETPGGEFIQGTDFQVNGPHDAGNVDWCALFS